MRDGVGARAKVPWWAMPPAVGRSMPAFSCWDGLKLGAREKRLVEHEQTIPLDLESASRMMKNELAHALHKGIIYMSIVDNGSVLRYH